MSPKRRLVVTMAREVDVPFLVDHLLCTDEVRLLGGLNRESFHLAVGAVDHTLGKMLEEFTRLIVNNDARLFPAMADDDRINDSQWMAEYKQFVNRKIELEEQIRRYCREQEYL